MGTNQVINKQSTADSCQSPADPFEPFGRAGTGPNVMSYSQVEYDAWLTDEKWTPHETNYLFSLLKTYDLRFLVVADRYAYVPPGGKTGQEEFQGVYSWPIPPPRKKSKFAEAAGSTGGKGKDAEGTRRSSRVGGAGGVNGRSSSRQATPVAPTTDTDEKHHPRSHQQGIARAIEGTDIKTRTIEEIKDRYYTICRRLLRNRPAVDEALKERMVKAYDYDIRECFGWFRIIHTQNTDQKSFADREIARKKYANSLFHLTRPQMMEEESLYVELKRMEQTERRYRSERDELLRVMGGLESGILAPGPTAHGSGGGSGGQGNRAFGRGEALGIGLARAADGTVNIDKLKKRRRGEEGGEVTTTTNAPPEPDTHLAAATKKKPDPLFDQRNNITHVAPQPGQLTLTRNTHQPVYLRSSRLPVPKPHLAAKTNAVLAELGVSTARLIMPTRENVMGLEKVVTAAESLVEMKRLVDRAEVELKTLKAQRDGFVPALGQPTSQAVQATSTLETHPTVDTASSGQVVGRP